MLELNSRNARAWSMMGASGVLGLAAVDLAERDDAFGIVTADLCFFSGLERFRAAYPDRLINVGIAEQNMVGVAAGMAKEGMHVMATTYASFATTRVLDQAKVCMGYMQQPVVLVGLTSGFSVGVLGATHMSIEDIAIMRSIPNIVILSPADCGETAKCIEAAMSCGRPVYLRLSGTPRTPIVYQEDYPFELGKAVTLVQGEDVLLIATGTMVAKAQQAVSVLAEQGVSCTLLDMHTIKPLDSDAILGNMQGKKLVVTAEEHSVIGGLGSAVAEILADCGNSPKLLRIGVEDYYPHAGEYPHLLRETGLEADQIAARITGALSAD